MQGFAGIFFHVGARQVHNLFNKIITLADLQHDLAAYNHGVFKLADLVALRQIRIEIVFAGKDGVLVYFGTHGQTKADSAAHGFAVNHR